MSYPDPPNQQPPYQPQYQQSQYQQPQYQQPQDQSGVQYQPAPQGALAPERSARPLLGGLIGVAVALLGTITIFAPLYVGTSGGPADVRQTYWITGSILIEIKGNTNTDIVNVLVLILVACVLAAILAASITALVRPGLASSLMAVIALAVSVGLFLHGVVLMFSVVTRSQGFEDSTILLGGWLAILATLLGIAALVLFARRVRTLARQ